MRIVLFFTVLFIITATHAQKQQDTVVNKNYFKLSLAELMNMEITVASKEAEKVSDAPGMITVYSDKEIEQYGYYTLSELANITSGYSKSPVQYGEYGFETRGQSAGGFENDKHLVLIDGIPVNFSRSYKAPIQEELPLFFAKRVEFLKGTGSALYGTSAFYGVVNITSMDTDEKSLIDSKISLGSFNQNYRAMGRAIVKNQAGTSHLMVGYYQQDASQDFVGITKDSTLRNWDNNNSLFLYFKQSFENTKLKGLQLGVINMRRNTGLGEYWGGPNSTFNNLAWGTFLPYLKYDYDFNSKLTVQNYVKANLSTENGTFGGYASYTPQGGNASLSEYQRRTLGIELLSEVKYKLRKDISIIGGVNYDNKKPLEGYNSYLAQLNSPDSISNYSTYTYHKIADTESITTLSAFLQGQFDLNFLHGLKITAGIREDYGFSESFSYSQLSPRLALVQKLSDKINIKLLAGQALRTPTVKTVGLNEETEVSINQLTNESVKLDEVKAETISSYEGGFTYNDKKINASIVIFSNSTQNQIVKAQYKVDGNDPFNIVKNLDNPTRAYGYEFDFQFIPKERFHISLNNSYAKVNEDSTSLLKFLPILKTNLLVTYIVSEKYPMNIALIGRHVLRNGDEENENGYLSFDANLIFPIIKELSIELQVKNILNRQVNDFSYINVPMPGRFFMGTISTKF